MHVKISSAIFQLSCAFVVQYDATKQPFPCTNERRDVCTLPGTIHGSQHLQLCGPNHLNWLESPERSSTKRFLWRKKSWPLRNYPFMLQDHKHQTFLQTLLAFQTCESKISKSKLSLPFSLKLLQKCFHEFVPLLCSLFTSLYQPCKVWS